MAKIDNDEVTNNSGNPSFQEIVEARLSRRGFLGGGPCCCRGIFFQRRECITEIRSGRGPRYRPGLASTIAGLSRRAGF